ncbi:hypothetical protein F8060_002018, partial [Neisseria gonorrhoeae]
MRKSGRSITREPIPAPPGRFRRHRGRQSQKGRRCLGNIPRNAPDLSGKAGKTLWEYPTYPRLKTALKRKFERKYGMTVQNTQTETVRTEAAPQQGGNTNPGYYKNRAFECVGFAQYL